LDSLFSFCAFVLRDSVHELFTFQRKGMLFSVGLGIAMVAATHIGYQGILPLWPELRSVVEALYFDIRQTSIPAAGIAAIILVVVAAEELVWRGVAFELLEGWASKAGVLVGSTMLYAMPQLIGGSWLLLCAALSLGFAWALQRSTSGRLTESFTTHGIWSVGMFCLVPLS
jgi:membrane protease YdiL (CAAX protease family)